MIFATDDISQALAKALADHQGDFWLDKLINAITAAMVMLIPCIALWIRAKAAEVQAKAAREMAEAAKLESEANSRKADSAVEAAKNANVSAVAVAKVLGKKLDENTQKTEQNAQAIADNTKITTELGAKINDQLDAILKDKGG